MMRLRKPNPAPVLVLGVHAPPPRPTRAGALWLASLAALAAAPVCVALELGWRMLTG